MAVQYTGHVIWDIVVFRFVAFAEYDLFKPVIFKQNFINIKFRINLTVLDKFLNTGISDRTLDQLFIA